MILWLMLLFASCRTPSHALYYHCITIIASLLLLPIHHIGTQATAYYCPCYLLGLAGHIACTELARDFFVIS